jgi:hypothetical protein
MRAVEAPPLPSVESPSAYGETAVTDDEFNVSTATDHHAGYTSGTAALPGRHDDAEVPQ